MRNLRMRPVLLALLLVASAFAYTPSVAAVGSTQSDMGGSGDLPDNMSSPTSIPNYIFSGSLTGSGDLVSGTDDFDYLRVALNANEGLAVQLDFNSVDDFDLAIYDANQNWLDDSWVNNPETVTTNGTAAHGGMVYIEIFGYSYGGFNPAGTWNITIWKFTVQSTGGGGTGSQSNGSAPPSPCTGNNTVNPDILEPNDSIQDSTLASVLPLDCTGLSIDSATDEDWFEVQMVSGTTYYTNISFSHSLGDIDFDWFDSSGTTTIGGSYSTSSVESDTIVATSNQTTYIVVYGYTGFGGTTFANTYDIEVTTSNPGGGQTFETVDVMAYANATAADVMYDGLTAGTSYITDVGVVSWPINASTWSVGTVSSYWVNATGTTEWVNFTWTNVESEGWYGLASELYDATGTVLLSDDVDGAYVEMLDGGLSGSTMAMLDATNLTAGSTYDVYWEVEDTGNGSVIDSGWSNFTASSSSEMLNITWTNPITTRTHSFAAGMYNTTGEMIGFHEDTFVPQLPTIRIDSASASANSSTNDVDLRGTDLVVGTTYTWYARLLDSGNATVAQSGSSSFTATAQNQLIDTWTYTTPNGSGTYCIAAFMFDANGNQYPGETDCITFIIDDDNDGVRNELDQCPNTAAGATVDAYGCSLAQTDTDGDGYSDAVDMFPNNPDQHWDTDGDGYGDNTNGTMGDLYPGDASQWADSDGDGYGDNASGTMGDAFPLDSTQWSDSDGDGYGDNPNGNNPDLWPADASQATDSDGDGYGDNPSGTMGDAFPTDASQWMDADGDGYGDNLNGTTPDLWPNDATQWHDTDGDGYGDNPTGTDGDAFPSDGTQWADRDGDGYGDNMNGNSPDAFPDEGTQWEDRDGDGYGDNPVGFEADAFPDDATQWSDRDGDGLGDEINGNNPDLCPDTPAGEPVDANGCADIERDEDEDGVTDDVDTCPNTDAGLSVDAMGCAENQRDSDLDGVMDAYDACPNSPVGRTVDSSGCALVELDTDGDGIDDARDQCPTTTPGMSVDGMGCAADERDADGDGVMDADDDCAYTDDGLEVDDHGCADNQRDTDMDTITDDLDACPMTLSGTAVDGMGCAAYQLDADDDGISDAIDECAATPAGADVDLVGCADTQLDEDGDGRNNAVDACPMTPAGAVVDILGCAKEQLDTDGDGIHDGLDTCPGSPEGAIVNADGCAKSQLDSDNDGVNDEEDAFPMNATATSDRDGDGVADQFDAYPDDGLRSTVEAESSSTGLVLGVVAILVIAGLAGLLMARRGGGATVAAGFADTSAVIDAATEHAFADKSLPELGQATEAPAANPVQWEENGVHWSKAADGSLSYYDAASGAWMPYQG